MARKRDSPYRAFARQEHCSFKNEKLCGIGGV